jgi:UDP-N-acetylglucosamine 2-epimerase (non-hydrolysing)/GDP/UDP-N,N'-diacetylbacillosamine 2-epimerase (hydrolysing)
MLRNVCFVTGTRAEYGLMQTTLRAIKAHKKLNLQIVATGMHLSRKHGYTVEQIPHIDAIVPWKGDLAAATGSATAKLAIAFDKLKTDIVLVVGDRVEAFAAATAGHLSGRIVAHIHGGDRALGQVDDALRHTITKLAHVHFAATPASAERIAKLGEDPWRIHLVGAPGIDDIAKLASKRKTKGRFALLILHPADIDDKAEAERARVVFDGVKLSGVPKVEIVYPNNDQGAAGIASVWSVVATPASPSALKGDAGVATTTYRNLARGDFLALLRDAAVLVGNSSSGIIEAASFGTPVVDIGPRQAGREHGNNVVHVDYDARQIARAIRQFTGEGWQRRFPATNVYGGSGAGQKIADTLARLIITPELQRKLITY